jgi:flagellar protein FlbT
MYIDEENFATYHKTYWDLVKEVIQAAPSTIGLIDSINELIFNGSYYQALKLAKRLIKYEQEAIERVSNSDKSL